MSAPQKIRKIWIGELVIKLRDLSVNEGIIVERKNSDLGDGRFLIMKARSWENTASYIVYKNVKSAHPWAFQFNGEYWELVAVFPRIENVVIALWGYEKGKDYISAKVYAIEHH